MIEEIRKDVEWFEWYQISSFWGIISLTRERKQINRWWKISTFMIKWKTLKPRKDSNWYHEIYLRKDWNSFVKLIHRLVAEAFIPNPENKPYVIHKDGDKLNNDLNNLMWATPKESSEITKKNNPVYRAKRENAGNSKLTEDDVRYIRSVYIPRSKEFGTRALGEKFGIHHTNISDVILRKTWKHVK